MPSVLRLILLLLLLFNGADGLLAQDLKKLRDDASKAYSAGNYALAFEDYKKLVLDPNNDGLNGPQDVRQAWYCLRSLGRQSEVDPLLDKAHEVHKDDWRFLAGLGQIYQELDHFGFIVSGKFERGSHRGGGRYVSSVERDRTKALSLMHEALLSMQGEEDAEAARFYLQFAQTFSSYGNQHESWRLQALTDFSELPEYEDFSYNEGLTRGAPVNADGSPVFYQIPSSFDAARSDGERYRFLLKRAKDSWTAMGAEVDFTFASFLRTQFGTETLADYGWYFFSDGDDKGKEQSATYSLHTLKEDETIARLASGVSRFTLPDEFNFIKIFKALSKDDGGYAENSLHALAESFENRRQFDTAASYWSESLKRFGDRGSKWKQQRLDSIVGAWGRFEVTESKPAGEKASLNYRFRNGSSAEFQVYEVKVPELLSDVKAYLHSNPARFEYDRVNISDIGYRLVQREETKYLGKKLHTWQETLKPKEKHFDAIETIKTPIDRAGVYLVRAKMAAGNVSQIILWLHDTAIIEKRLDGGNYYYVADAVSGKPLPNLKLDFFGYRMQHISGPDFVNRVLGRTANIHTASFSKTTNESGEVIVKPEDDKEHHQWLITASDESGRLAYLGFQGIWRSRYYDPEYNETKYYTITDRPVYRPEQEVKFKVWAGYAKFDLENNNNFAGVKLDLEVRNPRNEKIYASSFTTDSFGGLDGAFALPKGTALGIYNICRPNTKESCIPIGKFRVEEYKKPEFEVIVSAPTEPISLGEKFEANITAKYYFGEPVRKGKVKYKVERFTEETRWFPPGRWDWLYGGGYWWFGCEYPWYPGFSVWGIKAPLAIWWPRNPERPELVQENEVPIGEDGTIKITIDTALAKAIHGDTDHRYKISVDVTDESRRVISGSGEVVVARRPFKVYAWVDRGFYFAGDSIEASFSARTADNKPVKGSGDLSLIKISYAKDGSPNEKVLETFKLATNGEGDASFQLKAKEAGQYRVSFKLKDSNGHEEEGGYLFSVVGESDAKSFRFNEIELIQERREYEPGEKVKLKINTNQPDSTVLLFIRPTNGVYLEPKVLALKGKSQLEEIEVVKRDMPNFFVEAVTVSDGRVFSTVREIVVPPEKRVLNVSVLPSKKTFKPGEKAKIDLKVTDFFGKPYAGSLVMSVFDRSVEYISGGSNVSDIKEFFWKWRRHHQPVTVHNLEKLFTHLVQKNVLGMPNIGLFGDIVPEEGDAMRDHNVGQLAGAKGTRNMVRANVARFTKNDRLESTEEVLAVSAALAKPEAEAASEPVQGKESETTVRKNFADTAYWNGAISSNEEGLATVEFLMPENLTGWKIRTWAMGHGTRVGENSAEILTKKNILLRLQAPRFFVEKDEVTLSANVHNYLGTSKEVEVLLELEGETLKALSGASSRVQIESNREKRVDFRVKVLKEGEAVIRMKALTDEESDGMEMRFPVYVHGIEKTDSFSGHIRPEHSEKSFKINVPEKRKPEATKFEVRFSPTLALAMVDALPYLAAYPYGCTEQTLNRFLPSVITHKVLKGMGLDLNAIKEKRTNLNAQEIGKPAERAKQWKRFDEDAVFDEEEIRRRSQAGLNMLLSMQLDDGGWGWFSGYGEESYPHTTLQVTHGLQLARDNGLAIDPQAIVRAVAWLENYRAAELQKIKNSSTKTSPWKSHADDLDAFTYMVLSDESKPLSEMRELLYRDRNHLSVYGKTMLGLALFKEGQNEKLKMVMQNIEQYLVNDDENQTAYLRLPNQGYWWYWYGSEYETQAYYLKLLSKLEPKSDKASGLVKYLLNNRKHATYWNSTRDTAIVVEAFADYLKGSGETEPDLTITVYLDGKEKKTVKVNKDNLFSFDNTLTLNALELSSGEHEIKLKKAGKGPLYFNAYLTNFTLEDHITKAGLEIKVDRAFYRLKRVDSSTLVPGALGQAVQEKRERYLREKLQNLSQVKSGDLIEIELSIESKNDYEYLVFEDMKAAGFEPLEVQSGYTRNDLNAYVEFRDNRVAFFVRALARGKHSVSYRLRAEIPGEFSALPTKAYAMYAPELRANSEEIKVSVVE